MEKGVAAPAPETSLKWLGRTPEGGPTCLRQNPKPQTVHSVLLLHRWKLPIQGGGEKDFDVQI